MGCRHTKTKKGKENGGVFDTIPEPESPPPTDPRLPLNAREVFKLQKSWKGIKRNMQATGIEMFIRLFQNDLELKNLFKSFRDLPLDSDALRENEALEGHAMLVMGVIDDAISNIQDVDRVLKRLAAVGASHSRFEGFSPSLFWRMEEPFLKTLKLILEDAYTDNMDNIYRRTFRFIIPHLVKATEDAMSPSNQLSSSSPSAIDAPS